MRIDRDSFVPLYVQVRNAVERQILSHGKTGDPIESEPALCRRYGVSRITVRQALGTLEAEGLIRREPGRGTYIADRTTRKGLSFALVFGGLSDRYFGYRDESTFGDVVRGAAEVTALRGALIHPIPLGEDDDLGELLTTPLVHSFNGLLLRLGMGFPPDVLRAIDASGLPAVALKRRLPEPVACAYVDDRAACEEMTRHLLSLGHQRIAILLGAREMGVGDDRLTGYRTALVAAGIEPEPFLIKWLGFPMNEAGSEATLELLRGNRPPTAIFASSDYIAVGAYRAAREMGLEPGRDIAIAGYGGTAFSSTMYPPLTTVNTPGAAFGRVGANLLLDIVTGSAPASEQRTVPWHLEVRQSTMQRGGD